MKLVIVESPTKARTLKKFLGSDYQIEASMGHVRDLPKSKLSVDVDNDFAPDYVDVESRAGTIKDLKKAAKKASSIILATDPDREGEAIAYHVQQVILGKAKKTKKFKRIVFHEITKSAIEQALNNQAEINMDLVDAQQGRRVLDRLVGYKLSPLLWRKVRRGLSAGRVQSVAVRLVVEREREIEAFEPYEYWEIDVEVSKQMAGNKGSFVVRLVRIDDKKAEIGGKKLADEVVGDLGKAKYKVLKVERKETKTSPPPPYMTSTLQRAAANVLGWSGRRAMMAAQKLYEQGLITYHRTDSLNVANEALVQAREFIKSNYGKQYALDEPRRYRSKSKSAQEAHEAIRPSKASVVPGQKEGLGRAETRLYELIWKRFVASQMAQAVFDRTRIDVEADGKKEYLLRTTGKVMKFDGWMKLQGKKEAEKQTLPAVEDGDDLTKNKINAMQKFTEPPARFNEASLIKALEDRGIGRPSTYAPTISTIQARQYVEKKERRFHPTSVGIAVNDFLTKNFSKVMDYDFTAGMESDLDKVASGKKQWVKVIAKFYGPFEKKVESVGDKAKRVKVEVEKTGEKCPTCKKGEVVIRVGKFGKFLSCSTFPDCKYTANYVEKVEGVVCPDDGGEVVIRKTRKGKRFYGCINYPKCKWASWRKPK